MDDSKVVVIRNKNNVDLVIFTINGHCKEDIEEGVKKIKEMVKGTWSIEEIIEELGTMDISFSWSTDFETIYD